MPVDKDPPVERRTFFGDPALDDDLPLVNETFWAALVGHVVRESDRRPRVILDVGCHTGGLLQQLSARFRPDELLGIEPLTSARAEAVQRLKGLAESVTILHPSDWDRIPAGTVDLVTNHETLYLEPDLRGEMTRVRRVLSPNGVAFLVLGCHAENPLWETWKVPLIAAGHRVYDHLPLDVMEAAAAAGLLPAVQPLRRSGWITYDPLHAQFRYPDVRTMLDHHYRYKLIFRLRIADERPTAS